MNSKQRSQMSYIKRKEAREAPERALVELEMFGFIPADTYRFVTGRVSKVVKTSGA